MKNANYKIVEKPYHGGGTWYMVFIKRFWGFGLFSYWEHSHTEEKLTRAEDWIKNDKFRKDREAANPNVRYYL